MWFFFFKHGIFNYWFSWDLYTFTILINLFVIILVSHWYFMQLFVLMLRFELLLQQRTIDKEQAEGMEKENGTLKFKTSKTSQKNSRTH